MIYRYFVSYQFNSSTGSGFGSTELRRDKPILGHEDVNEISAYITSLNRFRSVVILNFQQFPAVGTVRG